MNSFVARSVKAAKYREVPAIEALYYSYWSGLPTGGELQFYLRGNRALAALPTHDDLTVVLVAWPIEEFETNKRDVEGHYLKAFDSEPAFAERIRQATPGESDRGHLRSRQRLPPQPEHPTLSPPCRRQGQPFLPRMRPRTRQ